MRDGRPTLPARVRRAFHLALRRRDRLAADTDDEIRFHLTQRAEALVARGVARDEAEAEALRRFGPLTEGRALMLAAARHREETLTMLERLDALQHDLGYAIRQLRRAPGFTAAVVTSFALGIGANATMFGIIDRVLLRPPAHVVNPARVVSIGEMRQWQGETYRGATLSYPSFTDYRDHVPAFAAVGAASLPMDASLGRGPQARKIQAMLVSASYLALTGAQPALGRFFTAEEDRLPDGVPVAVLSYAFWQRALGGRADALGRQLEIDAHRYTVVGVAPKEFTGLQHFPVDVFIPLTAGEHARAGNAPWATSRGMYALEVVARLAPGAALQQAQAQATTVLRRTEATRTDGQMPDTTASVSLQSVLPSADQKPSADVRVAKLVAAVSVLVLLIACANVANLLLARAVQRRREIAVRLALGVGRGRLAAQLVAEGVLLALLGGGAALLVVRWGGALVRSTLLSNYSWEGSTVDGRVLAFTAVVALATGLVAGLLPAVQASSPELTRALKEGAREGSPHRSRTRAALILVQSAFAVVLLVGTGLFVRSLRNVNAVQLGIDTNRVLVATMDLRTAGFKGPEIDRLYRAMQQRVSRSPGIASASIAGALPFNSSYAVLLKVPGHDTLPQVKDGGPYVNAVTADFFRTLGIHILRGRGFTAEDSASHARVMVVSESMARLIWRGENPIGQCLTFDSDSLPCTRIVGIAENTHRQGIVEDSEVLQYYVRLEYAPQFMSSRVLVARPMEGDPDRWVQPVRRALETTAPNLPYADVRPMRTLLGRELRPWELGATMFAIFGALALVLTAVGLYSVIAYGVAQRTHEMGVRIALGAQRADVLSLIVGQGVRIAAAGVAVGIVIALASARFVEPLLFQLSPRDPLTFTIVALVLLVVALVASLLPARRAASVDPVVALRTD